MSLKWKIDECSAYFDRMKLCGWCFVTGREIKAIEVVFPVTGTTLTLSSFGRIPSPDVAAAIDPAAHHARFDEWIHLPDAQRGRDFTLRLILTNGEICDTPSVHTN